MTGIVCASDALALGAIRAARKQGLAVPDDVSVIGFDDSTYMIATDPPLTTLRQPIQAMSAAAAAALITQASGGQAATEEVMFQPDLIVRASTAIRRR